jgi:hypothetical protein
MLHALNIQCKLMITSYDLSSGGSIIILPAY